MKSTKNNVDVQIALLEAQLGVTPNILWCADAVKNSKTNKRLSRMSESDIQAELLSLRKQKTEQKLFWIQKELNRTLKKAKTFMVQKIVKRLKEEVDNEKKKILEEKLADAKALQHQEAALIIFKKQLLNCEDEYVALNIRLFNLDAQTPDTNINEELLKQKTIQNTISELLVDLKQFFQKMFHENKERDTIQSDAGEDDIDDSLFVDSLCSAPSKPKLDKRNSSKYKEKSPVIRKKNRMGQKARRAMAEQQYGQKAKHLSDWTCKISKHSKDGSGHLHPSWEAKQQAKAREQGAQFQGCKFNFDSD